MGRGLGGLRAGKYSCAGDVICEEFVADFGPIVKVVRLLILPEEGHFVHQDTAPRISKMIPRGKETNVCADCKPDACIVDVRYGPDRTINRQCAVKRCEVREMSLVCDIELSCDGRFA